jgi:hypothetical protein
MKLPKTMGHVDSELYFVIAKNNIVDITEKAGYFFRVDVNRISPTKFKSGRVGSIPERLAEKKNSPNHFSKIL